MKNENIRRHWYAMVFMEELPNGYKTNMVYSGQLYKCVTKVNIRESREALGFSEDALLISCAYLGRMTIEQFDLGMEE